MVDNYMADQRVTRDDDEQTEEERGGVHHELADKGTGDII